MFYWTLRKNQTRYRDAVGCILKPVEFCIWKCTIWDTRLLWSGFTVVHKFVDIRKMHILIFRSGSILVACCAVATRPYFSLAYLLDSPEHENTRIGWFEFVSVHIVRVCMLPYGWNAKITMYYWTLRKNQTRYRDAVRCVWSPWNSAFENAQFETLDCYDQDLR